MTIREYIKNCFQGTKSYVTEQIAITQENMTPDAQLSTISTNSIQNKAVTEKFNDVINSIPKKLSELDNDTGFILNTVSSLANYYLKSEVYTRDEIEELINIIPKFSIHPVDSLPTENISTTTVYLLVSGDESQNLYTEYIYVNGIWEKLGTQMVDLSGYALKEDMDKLITLPEISSENNGQFLSVVDGVPTYVTVAWQVYRTGTDDPSDDLGDESDLYLKVGE